MSRSNEEEEENQEGRKLFLDSLEREFIKFHKETGMGRRNTFLYYSRVFCDDNDLSIAKIGMGRYGRIEEVSKELEKIHKTLSLRNKSYYFVFPSAYVAEKYLHYKFSDKRVSTAKDQGKRMKEILCKKVREVLGQVSEELHEEEIRDVTNKRNRLVEWKESIDDEVDEKSSDRRSESVVERLDEEREEIEKEIVGVDNVLEELKRKKVDDLTDQPLGELSKAFEESDQNIEVFKVTGYTEFFEDISKENFLDELGKKFRYCFEVDKNKHFGKKK